MAPDQFEEKINLDERVADYPGLGLEALVRELIVRIGENPDREGLLKTPRRVDQSFAFLTEGYKMRVEDVINEAIFREEAEEIVLVRAIEFYSLCEHHLLPFFGVAHVAYIPRGRVIGLSKIPRLVEVFARRLQVQERMTHQIAECIQEVLDPLGVAVIAEARHLCMMMRGVQKQSSLTTTSCMLGAFRENPQTRNELLSLIAKHSA